MTTELGHKQNSARDLTTGGRHERKPITEMIHVLKNGTRRDRDLRIALPAPIQAPVRGPRLAMATSGTAESIRPTHGEKMFSAGVLGSKLLLKLKDRSRMIFHTSMLHLVAKGVKRTAQFPWPSCVSKTKLSQLRYYMEKDGQVNNIPIPGQASGGRL